MNQSGKMIFHLVIYSEYCYLISRKEIHVYADVFILPRILKILIIVYCFLVVVKSCYFCEYNDYEHDSKYTVHKYCALYIV